MNAGSLFSGIGLLDYGLSLAGIEHSWLCEADPWRRRILAQRWPDATVYEDVREVDGSAPGVDLLAGGFPCRGVSFAGEGAGMENPETALWREMARIVGELRPRFVLLENVANLLAVTGGRAWGEVLGSLVALGYVCGWDCLPAAAFGAPHYRDRVVAVAADADGANQIGDRNHRVEPLGWTDAARGAVLDSSAPVADAGAGRCPADPLPAPRDWGPYAVSVGRWERLLGPAPEPFLRRVDAGGARRLVRSRLSALGDGVQVQVGFAVGRRLMREFSENPS